MISWITLTYRSTAALLGMSGLACLHDYDNRHPISNEIEYGDSAPAARNVFTFGHSRLRLLGA